MSPTSLMISTRRWCWLSTVSRPVTKRWSQTKASIVLLLSGLRTQHPQHLFQSGLAGGHLVKSVVGQRAQAAAARQAGDLEDAGAAADAVAQLVVRRQHFIEADASAVTAAVARGTTLAAKSAQVHTGEGRSQAPPD